MTFLLMKGCCVSENVNSSSHSKGSSNAESDWQQQQQQQSRKRNAGLSLAVKATHPVCTSVSRIRQPVPGSEDAACARWVVI